MNKSEKNTSNLIVPDDVLLDKIKKDRRNREADFSNKIKEYLRDAGFSNDDQEWLISLFNRYLRDCLPFRDAFTYSLFPPIVEKLGEPIQTEKDRQTRLALLFSLLIRCVLIRPEWASDFHEWTSKFQRYAQFCTQKLDWEKLVERTYSGHEPFLLFGDLVPFLCPEGVLLNHIVDLDRLNPIERRSPSDNYSTDPKQLEFWLIQRFENNGERCSIIRLDTLLQPFSDFSEDVLGDKILGLLNAISDAMLCESSWRGERLSPIGDGWRVVAHELIPFLDLLAEKEIDSGQTRSSLLQAWWRLSRIIYSQTMGGLEPDTELRNRLVQSAARHIGILRSILRDAPEVFENEEDEDSAETVYDFYAEGFYILQNFATPWKCLKPLLLAFTEMTRQAVTSDLRFFPELGEEEKLPHPYYQVPSWVAMTMYSENLRKELGKDPYLQGLREEFAKFCLARLKTKKKRDVSSAGKQSYTNEDFVESRPSWRQGYVQALAALRVNPGGRAHRTLFWLSQNDPNKTTRALAKRAHKQVRHLDRKKPNLDDGASPRRPLFEAFWWLRRAHLRTLGVEIDQARAMRTRRRELHRTREREDRRNPGRTS